VQQVVLLLRVEERRVELLRLLVERLGVDEPGRVEQLLA
jgi:hypothetical protein